MTSLTLKPGRAYRFLVKFCASEICFDPLRSDGVLVLSYPPKTGNLEITHLNVSTPTGNKDTVTYQCLQSFGHLGLNLICIQRFSIAINSKIHGNSKNININY